MLRKASLLALLVPCLVAACSHMHEIHESAGGDFEVHGGAEGYWTDGNFSSRPNFEWSYETSAFTDGSPKPFHRMRTDLQVSYDPETGAIHSARLRSSEAGGAFRHVCLTPAGPLLRIRVATLLDGRNEDLTVVRVHGTDPSTHMCEEVGVGPGAGIVEGVEVVFLEEGGFTVIPSTGASLFGSNLRLEREMSKRAGATELVKAEYP